MRILIPFLAATPAAAHTGHVGELAGHDHWVLAGGLGAIAAAAALGWLKGRRTEDTPDAEEASDDAPEPEEQPA